MKISMPEVSEYAPFYHTYVQLTKYDDLVNALRDNEKTFLDFLSTIPADKQDYRYADGKWSIKEVVIHLADAERIFAYRALRFARNDKTELAAFEENDYVPESGAGNRPFEELMEEHRTVREATISLFRSFSPLISLRTGIANKQPISVRALGAVTIGHTFHHMQIIKERYL